MADKDKKDESGEEKEPGKGKSKKKLIIMVVPVLLIALGAGWFFFLKPSGPKEEPPPDPGAVVALDAITINLASGHYLQLGIALQPTATAEEVTGEKALDAAINLYSGMSIEEISSKEGREKTIDELTTEVTELYEKEVYDVYLTEFVYQ
jgi:flagellar protein FliL